MMKKLIKNILPFVVSALMLSSSIKAGAGDIMSVRLLSDKKSLLPGDTITMGIEINMKNGWHTYWINPGDAGLPLKFEWGLPDGFIIGNITWPIPELITEDGIASLIYKGKVIIPVVVYSPVNFKGNKAALELNVKALVCKEKCIPSSGGAKLVLPINHKKSLSDPSITKRLKNLVYTLPASYPQGGVKASRDADKIRIEIPINELNGRNDKIEFYPYQEGIYNLAAGQETISHDEYAAIILKLDDLRTEDPQSVSGVLVNRSGWKNIGYRKAMDIKINLTK